jgi:hypothetical protein
MGHNQYATELKTDNTTAYGMINNTVQQKRSKAIDMRFDWVKDRVEQDQFIVIWALGDTNMGDYFTIVLRFEESELSTKYFRYVVPTERKLSLTFDKMKTSFGNGDNTATATANSWRTVQRNKQSARDMMSPKTTEDNQCGSNQRDSLCLQKGYLDVRFMCATNSPAASATFNLARSMKDFIIAGRQLDENF